MTDLAFEPFIAAGFTFFVAPHIVADVNALILFNPTITDIAILFFEFMKKGFLEIFLFWHFMLTCCRRIQDKMYQCKTILC